MSASLQLVRNSSPIIAAGQSVPMLSVRWAGNAARTMTAQWRLGTRSSAEVSSALGGQRTDGVAPGRRSCRPSCAPRK